MSHCYLYVSSSQWRNEAKCRWGRVWKITLPPKKTPKKTLKNTVIEDSSSGKKVVYKQIKHKPVLIKSNAVKQIYCKHVVDILQPALYS